MSDTTAMERALVVVNWADESFLELSPEEYKAWAGRLRERIVIEIQAAEKAARNTQREIDAKIAENVIDGYSANIRISLEEQEFSKDKNGPWVLNSDVAAAIRAGQSS